MESIGKINAAIYRNMQMILSDKLKELDIKNGQYDFFYVISRNEGISQKQLSEHLQISKSTTAKAIKSLIGKGYVKKEKDSVDNRIEHLYLTETGHEVTPLVAEIFEENIRTATRGLSAAELKQLIFLMNKVLENVVSEHIRSTEGGA